MARPVHRSASSATACAKRRFTARLLDLDPLRAAHVLIRLSVRHEDELAIVQIVDEIEHGLLKLGNWYALLLAGARERAASCARQSYMESRARCARSRSSRSQV